jgi:hypothetical protein
MEHFMSFIKKVLHCRRTVVSLTGLTCLTILGIYLKSTEVATSIAAICLGVSVANAGQGIFQKTSEGVAPKGEGQ